MIEFRPGRGGLLRAEISTAEAEAELYLQGGHLARWTPRGEKPVLFLSPKSLFTTGKAIRGGVPVIFPWFGARSDGKAGPAHGFARTAEWTLESSGYEDGKTQVALVLSSSKATRELFDGEFQLRLRFSIGGELEIQLETTNTGSAPFRFEEALHTYLTVSDAGAISIDGLRGTTYLDKTDEFKFKNQGSEPIRIDKETDQLHVNTESTCTVIDRAWDRSITIEKTGSDSTVIWNPWIEKTRGLSDMGSDSWRQMICVETANAADNAIVLAPGAVHRLTAKISVSS